jgi:FkbM family methyltransferase
MEDLKTLLKRVILPFVPDRALFEAKKVYYARALKKVSEEDEPDLKIVKYLVRAGDGVVDLGANIGVYTRFLSEMVGIEGSVFSVEPIPLTHEILRSNIRKLRLTNVQAMNYAVSDAPGRVCMEIPSYQSGGENYYQARITGVDDDDDRVGISVEARTVDSLFSDLPTRVAFVKCDVEGHELRCISGALGIIRKWQPAWLVEISGNPEEEGSSAFQTFKKLTGEGYAAYWFDGESLKPRRSGDKSVNYFFLMPAHIERLTERSLVAP